MAFFKSDNSGDKKKDAKSDVKTSTKDLYSDSNSKTKNDEKAIGNYSNAFRVLIQPLITEKATHGKAENKYFFEIAKKTNKIEVAKSIKQVYGIDPISVNIVNVKGKKTRYGRIMGKKSDWKKAVVTLPKEKTINVYEGV